MTKKTESKKFRLIDGKDKNKEKFGKYSVKQSIAVTLLSCCT